jgi:hypothetical protein
MADYRLAVSVISRSAGRSAMAAACRSASINPDERSGEVNYTRKDGVEWTGIAAPEGAPSWAQDRVKLWNAVEAETRKNSQGARETELSLSHEPNFDCAGFW